MISTRSVCILIVCQSTHILFQGALILLIKSSWMIHLHETVYSVHQLSVSQIEIIYNWCINVHPVQWSTNAGFLIHLLPVLLGLVCHLTAWQGFMEPVTIIKLSNVTHLLRRFSPSLLQRTFWQFIGIKRNLLSQS